MLTLCNFTPVQNFQWALYEHFLKVHAASVKCLKSCPPSWHFFTNVFRDTVPLNLHKNIFCGWGGGVREENWADHKGSNGASFMHRDPLGHSGNSSLPLPLPSNPPPPQQSGSQTTKSVRQGKQVNYTEIRLLVCTARKW